MNESKGRPRGATARYVVAILLVYAIASGGVVALLLSQMRAAEIVSGEKVVSALAQLGATQTSHVVSDVEQILQDAEARLSAATAAGTASEGSMHRDFAELLKNVPYLKWIEVLDAQGRVVYASDIGEIGRDLSGQPFFVDRRDRPGAGFSLYAPIPHPSGKGEWIPAALALRQANGAFSGVVVGAVDPQFFEQAWTLDDDISGVGISLVQTDGTRLIRIPRRSGAASIDGESAFVGNPVLAELRAGRDFGTLQAVRSFDQERRLLAYRRLPAFPGLAVIVSYPLYVALATWWTLVWLVGAGWAFGTVALSGLALWLAREWHKRHTAEERQRDLFEHGPNPAYAVDREIHRFIAVNHAAVAQYGWSREEFLAMTSNDLYLPEDLPAVLADRKLTVVDVTRTIHGRRQRKKDGTVIDVEMNVRLVELDDRSAFLVTIQDVTAKNQAEAKRLAAEKRLRAIMDNTVDGLIVIDQAGTVLSFNRTAETMFGHGEAEVVGQNVRMLMPEPLRAGHDGYLASYAATGHSGIIGVGREVVGVRKDGTEFPLDLQINEFLEEGGQRNFVGTVRDITRKKVIEEELRRSREHYRLLFDANPYATTVTDRGTMRIVAANRAAEALYGRSQEEMRALTADDFYPPEDVPAMRARRQAYRPDTPQMIVGLRHRKKDGTVFNIEMTARIIEYDGRPANLTIITDVSQRLAAEEQLRQSQKMEAVGQLTGGVAHDFNNILTIILANAEALQEEEGLEAGVANHLDRIATAVERASDLTRSLLAFSRKQPLRFMPTVLNDLVIATCKLLLRVLGEHIELDTVLADDIWTIEIDPAQLEAALVNLCVNARDAMPAGGRLLIKTKNVTLGQAFTLRHREAPVGDYVLLAVSDTGTGMPAEVLAKVFEPFFTTKEPGKGTGLGLSMVYGFIRQSKGYIDVESEVGSGTSFRLFLPRRKGASAEPEVKVKTHAPQGTERILVVEDDPDVRASVVGQLKSLGYTVSEAPAGAAGAAMLEAAAPPFDLLLTDVVMPGPMNGKALTDETMRRWPTTRIVFMSGYTDDALTQGGRLGAGVLLLNKPFRRNDLARIVRQALDGGSGSVGGPSPSP